MNIRGKIATRCLSSSRSKSRRTERQTDRQTQRDRRQIYRQGDRQTDRQEGKTERQTDRDIGNKSDLNLRLDYLYEIVSRLEESQHSKQKEIRNSAKMYIVHKNEAVLLTMYVHPFIHTHFFFVST